MTSRSSSHSVKYFFGFLGLILQPDLGDLGQLLQKDNPWHGFVDQGTPVLVSLRGERIDPPTSGSPVGSKAPDCDKWLAALEGSMLGDKFTPGHWDKALKTWAPWSKDELKFAADCDELPCDVKLDGAEVAKMEPLPEEKRQAKYLDLVHDRVVRYTQTQARKEYESKGDPVDPWKTFEEVGLRSQLKRPEGANLLIRKLDFTNDQAKIVRQILDERVARGPLEATVWRRDVYNDHYFDAQGEWTDVRCDPQSKSVYVVQGVMIELDMLKSRKFFVKLMQGKMRTAMEENGALYLDRWFERIKKRAEK